MKLEACSPSAPSVRPRSGRGSPTARSLGSVDAERIIVVRAPLRVSFAGGGTDFPDFYHRYTGRVISTTINKFVYVVVHPTPLVRKVSARCSVSETVDRADDLQHTRIRAALTDFGIEPGLEIGSFASLPAKTGLGSSSSFTVALVKALHAHQAKRIALSALVEAACRIEIELLGEPIGKQDQYAAAYGGCNIFEFRPDGMVAVEPVRLSRETQSAFEDHLLLFFTGTVRDAASILRAQKANIERKVATLREIADMVPEFAARLARGDFKGLGAMLHEGWNKKKSLAPHISNGVLDEFYRAGMDAGAWGGKVAGAGGGGCVVLLAPPRRHEAVRRAVGAVAHARSLREFCEVPMKLFPTGAELILGRDENEEFIRQTQAVYTA